MTEGLGNGIGRVPIGGSKPTAAVSMAAVSKVTAWMLPRDVVTAESASAAAGAVSWTEDDARYSMAKVSGAALMDDSDSKQGGVPASRFGFRGCCSGDVNVRSGTTRSS